MKQTHDKKLVESFVPITKQLEEVDKSTSKMKENLKNKNENVAPQLAIENTQPAIQNTKEKNIQVCLTIHL